MIKINLLKPGKKEIKEGPTPLAPEFKEKKKQPLYSLIILVAIIAIAALFFFQKSSFNEEQNLLRTAQEEKKELEYVEVKLAQLEQQRDLINSKISLIRQLQSHQEVAVRIIDELSKNIPGWVWLTETTYENYLLKINGQALSNNLIADYIFNLNKSPYFRNVSLISSTQSSSRTNQYLEFSLTAKYVLPPAIMSPTGEAEKREEK